MKSFREFVSPFENSFLSEKHVLKWQELILSWNVQVLCFSFEKFTFALQPDIFTVITVVRYESSSTVRYILIILIALHIIHYNCHIVIIQPVPVSSILWNLCLVDLSFNLSAWFGKISSLLLHIICSVHYLIIED